MFHFVIKDFSIVIFWYTTWSLIDYAYSKFKISNKKIAKINIILLVISLYLIYTM